MARKTKRKVVSKSSRKRSNEDIIEQFVKKSQNMLDKIFMEAVKLTSKLQKNVKVK